MNFIMVGLNHRSCPLQIRERFSFPKQRLSETCLSLLEIGKINAAVILSTCNRVEFYASIYDITIGLKILKTFLLKNHQQPLNSIEPYLYSYVDNEALLHLFRVASGLDSQIIGETQILEQVKFSYQLAKAIAATDGLLDKIFNTAIKVSLRVKDETQISQGDISIATIVLELLRVKLGTLKDKGILVIGTGAMAKLLAQNLKEKEPRLIFIAKRNFELAEQLARQFNAEALRLDRLKEKLQEVDIVISATSSPHLILRPADLAEIRKPLLMLDLAVPRDIDPRVKDLPGISLFNLDDLDFIIARNLTNRKKELPKAEEIIQKEVDELCLSEDLELAPEPALWP